MLNLFKYFMALCFIWLVLKTKLLSWFEFGSQVVYPELNLFKLVVLGCLSVSRWFILVRLLGYLSIYAST